MNLFKKVLCTSIAAGIFISNVFVGAGQTLIANAEKYGDYLSYIKNDKDGDGTYDCVSISYCDKSTVSVEIPSEIDGLPVTSIDETAFRNCTGLESVTIPDSVTTIGGMAFFHCTSLKSVTIPNSVTTIGSMAFGDTALLDNQTGVKYADTWVVDCDRDITSVEIKKGTKGICDLAFYSCTSLKNITIPDSVTSIGDSAFEGCKRLESVTIPDLVTSICRETFSNCENLVSVTIPDSVTSIGNHAFCCCESLESIIIGNSVTSIGDMAFLNCTSLASVRVLNPNCKIYDSEYTITNDYNGYFGGTIYGYEDSTAQAYAEKYGYKFESLGEPPVTTAPSTTTAPTTTTTAIITTQAATSETSAADTTAAIETTTMTTAAIAGITVPTGVTATKYGDVNLDKEINISDVVAINLYILNQKEYPLEDKAIANADCVKDNIINTSDSTILMNYAAEIIDISELGK